MIVAWSLSRKIVSRSQERFDDDDAKEYYASAYNTHSKTTRTTNNRPMQTTRRVDGTVDASLYVSPLSFKSNEDDAKLLRFENEAKKISSKILHYGDGSITYYYSFDDDA